MVDRKTLDQSSRVALAAYLHDLGKFAERARIEQAQAKDADGNTAQARNEQLYCPRSANGRPTHIHAAYTAIALDLIESHLPALIGDEMTPFAPWRDRDADDSLINGAAMHHRPQSCLQWIVATADRLASGFEREAFDAYNTSADDEAKPLNHYTTRQWTLFEEIRLDPAGPPSKPEWRYRLAPMSADELFPATRSEVESIDKARAQAEYRRLWEGFVEGLELIPTAHRQQLALWLDHFDSLWLAYTHAIASATAGLGGAVKPNVSLYDHSRTTAALAVALWRHHTDCGHPPDAVHDELRAMWDRERSSSPEASRAWSAHKILLVQGDFFGIQDFIFAEGGQTQRSAAKLLRGRSFYVSLLTELAALKVLDALALPPISQVVNAAGKFLIVAPNTPQAVAALQTVQRELDRWFLEHTHGGSGIGLAWLEASAADFRHGGTGASPFSDLMRRLFDRLEARKLQRLDLCGPDPVPTAFDGFLDRFELGECQIDGRSPAAVERDGIRMSRLAADQIDTGHWLATEQRVLITRSAQLDRTLALPVFGYRVSFTGAEAASGRFGELARSGDLVRAFDFSPPRSGDEVLWNGYARRHINAYVPRFGTPDEAQRERYRGLDEPHPDEPKSLNHLARDDQRRTTAGEQAVWTGAEALTTLKGDVDNLGTIFQRGLEQPTFARMAALSRQMNAFFTVHLPLLCAREFPSTYTVFAGGDDFFLIGPWHSTIRLAGRMKDDFKRYVAGNPDIHFSAGLSMTKPGLPIRQLASRAEDALDAAKAHRAEAGRPAPKNAVSAWGMQVDWPQFDQLVQGCDRLAALTQKYSLSTGYLYRLLRYADMAHDRTRPESALWRSHFAYSTRRLVEREIRNDGDRADTERRRRDAQGELAAELVDNGIRKHGAAYKIALFTHLYQNRD